MVHLKNHRPEEYIDHLKDQLIDFHNAMLVQNIPEKKIMFIIELLRRKPCLFLVDNGKENYYLAAATRLISRYIRFKFPEFSEFNLEDKKFILSNAADLYYKRKSKQYNQKLPVPIS